MTTIYRGSNTTLWVKLRSDEQLGLLETGYIEDYDGVDGSITLHHLGTSTDYQVAVSEESGYTPGTPNDGFQAAVPLSSLPDGTYQVRGKARDLLNNVTVLGSVSGGPVAGARVLDLQLTISSGSGVRIYVDSPFSAQREGYKGQVAKGSWYKVSEQ